MNILFLSTWLPYPPDQGSRIRTYNVLKQLAREHEITLAAFIADAAEREHAEVLRGWCTDVHCIQHNPFARPKLKSLTGFLNSKPRSLVAGHSAQMQQTIEHLMGTRTFDVAIAEVMAAASYMPCLRRRLPAIYDDLEISIFFPSSRASSGLFQRLRHRSSLAKLRNYLYSLLTYFDAYTVPSNPEREVTTAFLRGYQGIVSLMPNGVDSDAYRNVVPAPSSRPYLVFNGSLTYSANYGAMDFFLRDVWPLVVARDPELGVKITGNTDGVSLSPLALTANIELTGYLDDVRPTVAGAAACVVPILAGGGTRLKILEAMALGVPVVATSKAAEGLDMINDKHLLIADDPVPFADAIERLRRNPSFACELAAQAQSHVYEHYSWTTIGDRFLELIERIATKGGKTTSAVLQSGYEAAHA